MKQLLILIVITTLYMYADAYALDQYNDEDFPQYFKFNTREDATCTKPGPLCKNCQELVNCVKLGTDDYLEVHIKTCGLNNTENATKNEYCLIDKCSTDPNPLCTPEGARPFECQNTGVYPDPRDCRIYHICVEKQHLLQDSTPTPPPTDPTTPDPPPSKSSSDADIKAPTEGGSYIAAICDDGYGYNPITTYCDKKLANGVCSGTPVPICEKALQMGPIAGTSIFYICTEDNDGTLAPKLYMCPHGSKFVNGGCA